jgi:hypothetical protein
MISCDPVRVSPQETFDVCGLSLNKIPYKFSQHFKEIRAQHKNGSLTYVTPNNEVKKGVSAEEYVQNMYPNMFKKEIEALNHLSVNDETRPMQQATLDVFKYSEEVYKNDMLPIAKMIDEGKSDQEIDAAIENLQNTKGKIIDEKFNKAHDLVFPYADKHGIKYEILEYPN